ncbi:MAG: hypothetical protein HONBIEJF_00321 [Fimbriimonadaceae bacterium]|nr:hypothetical protein [Fimbriimonadaceae bacterium]
MVEVLVTIAITGFVVGATASLFGFSSVRLSDTYGSAMLQDQINDVADDIEATIRNAILCESANGGATLKCVMPLNGVDSDEDGSLDTYYPDKVDARGNGQYSEGNIVWFYATGPVMTYTLSKSNVWRAEKAGSTSPGTAVRDDAFAYYYGGARKNPLVNYVTYSVDAVSKTVTFTVYASTKIGKDASAGALNDGTTRIIPVTRTVQWGN